MQEEDNSGNKNNDNEDDGENEPEWSMLQCMPCAKTNLHTTEDFKKIKLILDTGLTIKATIKDKEIVCNICKSSKPIVMATNAGQKVLLEDAELVGLGTVKYDKEQISNILGFSHMSDKYCCLLYTSPSPRDATLSRMPSSA